MNFTAHCCVSYSILGAVAALRRTPDSGNPIVPGSQAGRVQIHVGDSKGEVSGGIHISGCRN